MIGSQEAQLLVQRGVRVIGVLIDPHSFGVSVSARRAEETRACLEISGVTTSFSALWR